MNKIGSFTLNIAVALYLFANGIMGITQRNVLGTPGGDFEKMVQTILGRGDLTNIVTIILSVFAIAAGIFLLMELFNTKVKIKDLILFIFIIVWAIFMVIVDIVYPLQSSRNTEFLPYLLQLSSHLMVLGALIMSTKRFR
jgi:hypothetical protein